MLLQHLIPRLKKVERFSKYIYIDTTGNITWAYGLNLGHVKCVDGKVVLTPVSEIPENVASLLLLGQVTEIATKLTEKLGPWFGGLGDVRREVLIELCFNIGMGVLTYKTFMHQLERDYFIDAAANMRSWLWYKQVGAGRAEPLCRMMETGKYPGGAE